MDQRPQLRGRPRRPRLWQQPLPLNRAGNDQPVDHRRRVPRPGTAMADSSRHLRSRVPGGRGRAEGGDVGTSTGGAGGDVNKCEICCICQEEVPEVGRGIIPCGHPFCFKCIHKWAARRNACPTCRAAVTQIVKTLTPKEAEIEEARRKIQMSQRQGKLGLKRLKRKMALVKKTGAGLFTKTVRVRRVKQKGQASQEQDALLHPQASPAERGVVAGEAEARAIPQDVANRLADLRVRRGLSRLSRSYALGEGSEAVGADSRATRSIMVSPERDYPERLDQMASEAARELRARSAAATGQAREDEGPLAERVELLHVQDGLFYVDAEGSVRANPEGWVLLGAAYARPTAAPGANTTPAAAGASAASGSGRSAGSVGPVPSAGAGGPVGPHAGVGSSVEQHLQRERERQGVRQRKRRQRRREQERQQRQQRRRREGDRAQRMTSMAREDEEEGGRERRREQKLEERREATASLGVAGNSDAHPGGALEGPVHQAGRGVAQRRGEEDEEREGRRRREQSPQSEVQAEDVPLHGQELDGGGPGDRFRMTGRSWPELLYSLYGGTTEAASASAPD